MNRRKFISGASLPRTFEPIRLNQVWRWKETVARASERLNGKHLQKWGIIILSEQPAGDRWMVLDVLKDRKGIYYKSMKRDRTMSEDDIYKTLDHQVEIKGEALKVYNPEILLKKA